MLKFGENVTDIEQPKKEPNPIISLPSEEPTKTLKKNPHPPGLNHKNVKKYLKQELSRLDKEWNVYNIKYEEAYMLSEEGDDGADDDIDEYYETCLHIESKVDALFDFMWHFGLDANDFLEFIPFIQAYTIKKQYKEMQQEEPLVA